MAGDAKLADRSVNALRAHPNPLPQGGRRGDVAATVPVLPFIGDATVAAEIFEKGAGRQEDGLRSANLARGEGRPISILATSSGGNLCSEIASSVILSDSEGFPSPVEDSCGKFAQNDWGCPYDERRIMLENRNLKLDLLALALLAAVIFLAAALIELRPGRSARQPRLPLACPAGKCVRILGGDRQPAVVRGPRAGCLLSVGFAGRVRRRVA